MNEQEAKVLTARLLRVWGPFKQILSRFGHNEQGTFGAWVTEGVALYIDVHDLAHEPFFFEMRAAGHDSRAAGLTYEEEINDRCNCEEQEEFTNTWLAYFRRGLWLSGCDIEASAHEKAEWIRGFTKEEVEAWNLKM